MANSYEELMGTPMDARDHPANNVAAGTGLHNAMMGPDAKRQMQDQTMNGSQDSPTTGSFKGDWDSNMFRLGVK